MRVTSGPNGAPQAPDTLDAAQVRSYIAGLAPTLKRAAQNAVLALPNYATAAFAVPPDLTRIELHLPTGETLSLPGQEKPKKRKKVSPVALACRGGMTKLAESATFWFPVDEAILKFVCSRAPKRAR